MSRYQLAVVASVVLVAALATARLAAVTLGQTDTPELTIDLQTAFAAAIAIIGAGHFSSNGKG